MKATEKAKESSVKTVNPDEAMGLTESAVAIVQPIIHHKLEQGGSIVASEYQGMAQKVVQLNTVTES